jgi:hypothetical protein
MTKTYTFTPDYFIPEEKRGKEIDVPRGWEDWPHEPVKLNVPASAVFMHVDPYEVENEFDGDQSASDKIRLLYYNSDKQLIDEELLFEKVECGRLMSRLELILRQQYK